MLTVCSPGRTGMMSLPPSLRTGMALPLCVSAVISASAGKLDEEVLAEAAAQREIELRGALALAERDLVRAAADRDGRAGDRLGPADRERPRSRPATAATTGRRASRDCRGFEDGREAGDRDVPDRRRDEMPALDPRIVRARGERERAARSASPLSHVKRLLLRAEPHLDEAVLHDGIGRQHVLARQQRHAQARRLCPTGESRVTVVRTCQMRPSSRCDRSRRSSAHPAGRSSRRRRRPFV